MTSTDTPGVGEPEAQDAVAAPPAAPSRLRKWGLRIGVAAVVTASLGTAVYFYRDAADNRELIDAQSAARDAACAYAPILANYSFEDLDAYFTAVLDGATGDWKTEFDKTSKDLRDVLAQGKVVSKAADVQCALQNGDQHQATAIVVIGQSVSSVGTEGKPQPGQLSMVLSLEYHDGRWLVNKLDSPLLSAKQ